MNTELLVYIQTCKELASYPQNKKKAEQTESEQVFSGQAED